MKRKSLQISEDTQVVLAFKKNDSCEMQIIEFLRKEDAMEFILDFESENIKYLVADHICSHVLCKGLVEDE